MVDEETFEVSRDRVLELQLHAQIVRACKAELALAEERSNAFQTRLVAHITSDGAYKVLGDLDLSTGMVKRAPVDRPQS